MEKKPLTPQMKASEVATIDAHGRHAQAVYFTKDNKTLVSAGQDACVRLWSIPEFQAKGSIEGHKKSVNSLSFTSDERLLATGSTDRTVRVWSFPEGKCRHTLDNQMTAVFSQKGDRLATISFKGEIGLWEGSSGHQLASLSELDRRPTSITFTRDGSTLLVGGMGPIHQVAVAAGNKTSELKGHQSVVTCLRVSPDGKWLASTGADGYLRIWSTADWSEAQTVKIEGSGVFQIAFSPGSDSITVSADFVIRSYAVKDGKLLERIQVPLKGLYGVAISADGKYLANAAADGRIRVWERGSGGR